MEHNIQKKNEVLLGIDKLMYESSLMRKEINSITNINSQRDIELRVSLKHLHSQTLKQVENSLVWVCKNLDNEYLLRHLKIYSHYYRYAPIMLEFILDPSKNPTFIDSAGREPIRKDLVDLC